MKKGFLTAPDPPKKPRRKKAALPDEAFLPAESYALANEDELAVDPMVADIDSSEAAHEYSVEYCRAHCNQYNQATMKLDPYVNMAFCEDLRVVFFNRKMHGHHDGGGKGGAQRTMLLPSGIVMHYLEWGSEQAPPIVMLHDVCDSCHSWDDVAQPLAQKYRVLALDLRGHGESSWSSRREYGVEHHVEDVHELVVRLSLNGREWGGAHTRPWVLCGKGMGGAVAAAYAARHVGRVAGLVLWDYDPEWPKDRLCFYPYQAGHFLDQEPLAVLLGQTLGLEKDPKYLSIQAPSPGTASIAQHGMAPLHPSTSPHSLSTAPTTSTSTTRRRAAGGGWTPTSSSLTSIPASRGRSCARRRRACACASCTRRARATGRSSARPRWRARSREGAARRT